MSALTGLTLAAARDGLRTKKFSAVELTKAHVAAVEAARPLNAFITETPELALKLAQDVGRPHRQGAGRRAGRPAAGHQGSVLHQGRAHHGQLAHPRKLRAAL